MNSPYMSSEEGCIQEAIAQFYSFFGQMQSLKNDIEQLNYLDDVTRNRIMYQLDSIESEFGYCANECGVDNFICPCASWTASVGV